MNIFKRFKQKREQKRKLRELRQMGSVFSTLDRLEQSGMLIWDAQKRQLFIAESLALLMMKDAGSWATFVQNTYLWLTFHQAQQAVDDYMLKEELAAVRKASVGKNHEKVQLSRADIDRIRRARRQEITESEVEPPKLEPFEFFIVQESTEAKAKISAVGYFDPETDTQELRPWDEIEHLLKAE